MKNTATELLKRYVTWTILLAMTFLVAVAVIFLSAWRHEEAIVKERLATEVDEDAQLIDDDLRHARLHLSTIRIHVRDYYRLGAAQRSFGSLFGQLYNENDYFTLPSASWPYTEEDVGTILARGGVTQLTPAYRDELLMALSLFPVQKRDFGDLLAYKSSYYLSAQDFVTFYPQRSVKGLFQLSPNGRIDGLFIRLHDRLAWQMALPDNNSTAKIILTEPYIDAISGERVVTFSLPVYREKVFQGVFSIDLPFETVTHHLIAKQPGFPGAYALLSQTGALLMADNLPDNLPDDIAGQTQAGWRETSGPSQYIYYEDPLQEAPWRLIYIVDKKEIAGAAMTARVFWVSLAGLVLFFMLTGWLMRREFVLPALKLVRYLDHSALTPVESLRIPHMWAGAFEKAAAVFSSNRHYVAQLNEENIALQKLFFDLHPTMMLVLEADTHYVTQMNASARAFYGEKLIGQTVGQVVMEGQASIDDAENALAEQGRAAFQTKHYRHDGAVRDIWLVAFPVVLQRRSLLLLIAEDITERLEMRDQLLSLREGEWLRLKRRSQVLFAILEKIRQHTAYHAVCAETNLRPVSEEIFPLLEDAGEMIRLDLDPLFVRNMNFSPGAEIEGVLAQLHPELEKKSIKLSVYGLTALPHQLCGDLIRYRRILSLLLEDVIEEQRQNTVVLHLTAKKTGAVCLCQITLIAGARECEKLTEDCPSLGENELSDSASLGVAQRLIQTMGGELTFDRRPGEGVTYWYTLQLREVHDGLLDQTPDSFRYADADEQGKVLIVDESLANRRVLGASVERLGHYALYAQSSEEAVRLIQTEQVSLVVLDLQMPDADGWTTLRRMEEVLQHSGRPLPAVLFVTEDDSAAIQERVKQTRAIGCLMKPVEEMIFKEYVRSVFLAKAKMIEISALEREEKTHFDEGYLLRNLESDRTLMQTILLDFIQEGPDMLAVLASEIEAKRTDQIAWQAHKVKGAFASIGAERMRMLILAVETAAETADPDFNHLRELMSLIHQEYQRLTQCLEEWIHNERT